MSRDLRKIDPARYRQLLSRTMPIVIETEAENERILAVVEKLMDKSETISPEEEKLLKLLARLMPGHWPITFTSQRTCSFD